MKGKSEENLYKVLRELDIEYEVFEHDAAPTIEKAQEYWSRIDSTHCKNLFFRNHKGRKHYLVVLEQNTDFQVRNLEQYLGEGKLTFASTWRLEKYLGVSPGSVTPFGLINDIDSHVTVFLDPELRSSERISFHPTRNTASLVLSYQDFIRFLEWTGNRFAYMAFPHV